MNPPGQRFQLGPPDWGAGTRGVLIATAIASLAGPFLPPAISRALFLPDLLKPWSLATSIFYSSGLVPFLIVGIMLWMFGSAVESRMGRNGFLGLYIGAGVAGNLAACLFQGMVSPLWGWATYPVGSAYSIGALFVAWGHFHRHADVLFMFLIKVNAWNLVFYGLGLDLLFLLLNGQPHYFGLLLAGLGTLFYLTRGQRIGGPLANLQRQANAAYSRWQHKRKSAHLQVLKGGKDDAFVRDDEGAAGEDDGDGDGRPPVIH